ncbi:MAG TPA: sialidase family protein [Chryseosolibacter sp.]|nr:sialidase family protein [Chryseosolibacter sp.]
MKPYYLITVLCLYASMLSAQIRNIKIDEQSADDPYVCEPSVAINPKNPLNIVAASVLNNIYVTTDGGKSWTKVDVTSPFGVYGDPVVIADHKGKFYFFHLSDPTNGKGGYDSEKLDRMVVQESNDGGFTWSEGESIGYNHPKDQDKEWAAIDSKGNVYLTWTEFDKYGDPNPDCHSRILFSKSRNGRKWSAPVTLSEIPGNCIDDDYTAEGAVPGVNSEGKVFVAWSNQNKIFVDRSYDGGQTWLTNDLPVVDQPGGWDIKIPGHDRSNGMPVLMINQSETTALNHIYIVWADTKNGENDTDVWFIRSANNGDNWTTPLRINSDVPGKHQYLPWMAVDQVTGYIYVVYYDRRSHDDNQTDVYLAYSVDSGNSFKEVKISETAFVPTEEGFFGDYTNISAHNGTIVPIWARMDDGKTSVMSAVISHDELVKAK